MNTFQTDGLSILLRVIGRFSEDESVVSFLDSILEIHFFGSKRLEMVDYFDEVRR